MQIAYRRAWHRDVLTAGQRKPDPAATARALRSRDPAWALTGQCLFRQRTKFPLLAPRACVPRGRGVM